MKVNFTRNDVPNACRSPSVFRKIFAPHFVVERQFDRQACAGGEHLSKVMTNGTPPDVTPEQQHPRSYHRIESPVLQQLVKPGNCFQRRGKIRVPVRPPAGPFEKLADIEAICLVLAGDDDAHFSHTAHSVSPEICICVSYCGESSKRSRNSMPRRQCPFPVFVQSGANRAMASVFSGVFRRKMLATLST